MHLQSRPLPPPGLAGPSPVNYYASPCNLSVISSDPDDGYVHQLEAMAEAAGSVGPPTEAPDAPDDSQDVHLRYLDVGDSHTDMEPQTQEQYADDGHGTHMLYDLMADYPSNWPGGSP